MAYIKYRRQRRLAGGARVRGRRMYLGRGPRAAARARLGRFNPTPTFTETYVGNPIPFRIQGAGTTPGGQVTAAGLIAVAMGDIPQIAQYTALYNQYCIRKVTAIMVPAYNVYDQPAVGSSVTQAPRLVTAIQDSADQAGPTSELDVLQDNAAKIRMFTKPVKFSWRPVAQVGESLLPAGGGLVGVSRKNRWLSTNNIVVPHNGLAYAFTTDTPPVNPDTTVLANVYFKITFSLRDPK